MIRGLALLLVCQLLGEVAARGTGLSVPGPVIGLVLLVLLLVVAEKTGRLAKDDLETNDVGRVSDALLANLSLLFVPAGVGLVQYVGLLGEYGLALGLSLVGSTLVTLLVTVGVFLLVKRWTGSDGETAP